MQSFTLRIEQTGSGLVCITSPEIKSLFVADETLDGALQAVPGLVKALTRQEPHAGRGGEEPAE
ncbi:MULTISPECIES: hypothetical protein [Methylobacterium]|jgi:hypothetical protein|uniref:Uncharacterized protein n=1 Tax=Methylobacterium isbiliense TaxID=315478 RepID=A0ABQ4S8B9_9HYPH|nr:MULTISPECIES: hypothetical protein [Methylobacterium]MBY0299001.1 hypothetical protein [Methylobacterium sp.]MDN3625499.1 hypothetical protein [Methylobacterium isbiliense]GJD98695.1 hypothetical protein GMJLKIPL_0606 [Methylobacterium isbiliense]